VYIFGKVNKLVFVGNPDGFIRTLEKRAKAMIVGIKIADILSAERTHKMVNPVVRILFNKKMEVVRHQTVTKKGNFLVIVFKSP
jgi:hypothetical protein